MGKVVPYDYRSHVKTTFRFKQKNRKDVPFVMSGGYDFHEKRGHFIADQYAGKIDRTGICNRILSKEELDKICSGEMPEKESILAYWDTSKGYTENGIGNTVFDVGPHKLDAEGFNHVFEVRTHERCTHLTPSSLSLSLCLEQTSLTD